jgi:hypothetical protein
MGSYVTRRFEFTIHPASVGGFVSGGNTPICLGAGTGTMTLTGHTGNVVKWQKRLNTGAWSDITITATNYSETPASAGSWEYRAEVKSGTCASVFSSSRTIVVEQSSVGGFVTGGNTPICLGAATGTMTLTGHTGNVVKWQKRLNTGAWSDITNTATTYSETPTSAGTWEYQVVVKNGNCSETTSGIRTITVDAASEGGTLTGGNSPIALGSGTGTMTLNSYTGTITKWQKSLNAGVWSDIVNTATTYSDIPTSIGTWHYRVLVKNGSCPEAYSTEVSIVVEEILPIDLILLLDISGSMGGRANPGNPADTDTKLEKLQEAIDVFLTTYDQYSRPDDRIGVVYFESNVDNSQSSLINFENNINAIRTDVYAKNDGGWTAMGGGLQVAIDTLLDNVTGHSQNIILVTDGEQNVNPMVISGSLNIENQTPLPQGGNSTTNPHTPPLQVTGDKNIEIYPIGINAYGSYASLLNTLATVTGGDPNLEPTDNSYVFASYLTESFINLLRDASPQLVDYRFNTMNSTEQVEVFTIDRDVNHVLLRINGNDDISDLTFSVEKDMVDMTACCGRLVKADHYYIYSVNLPVTIEGQTIHSEGEWIIRLSGPDGIDYEACAIVDNHSLSYNSWFSSKEFMVGDYLDMVMSLKYSDIAVDGASIKATMFVPRKRQVRAFSTISVATMTRGRKNILTKDMEYLTRNNSDKLNFQDLADLANRKWQILANSPLTGKFFRPKPVDMSLSYRGDGKYNANITTVKRPGVYRVDFYIKGHHNELGNFTRKETESLYINYGYSNKCRSRVRLLDPDLTTNIPMRIYLRPKDKYGNLLGPGFSHGIEARLSSGTVGDPIDHLDGSYTLPIYDVKDSDQVEVELLIMGKTLYDGSLGKLRSWLPGFIRKYLLFPDLNDSMKKGIDQ